MSQPPLGLGHPGSGSPLRVAQHLARHRVHGRVPAGSFSLWVTAQGDGGARNSAGSPKSPWVGSAAVLGHEASRNPHPRPILGHPTRWPFAKLIFRKLGDRVRLQPSTYFKPGPGHEALILVTFTPKNDAPPPTHLRVGSHLPSRKSRRLGWEETPQLRWVGPRDLVPAAARGLGVERGSPVMAARCSPRLLEGRLPPRAAGGGSCPTSALFAAAVRPAGGTRAPARAGMKRPAISTGIFRAAPSPDRSAALSRGLGLVDSFPLCGAGLGAYRQT